MMRLAINLVALAMLVAAWTILIGEGIELLSGAL
jgi:hypothetical protein